MDSPAYSIVKNAVHGIGCFTLNCVGSFLLKPAHLTSAGEWQETLSTNLTSAFATVRGAAVVLRERGGAIVLMTTAAARSGLPHHEAIAAAKGGVIGLTLSAAASYVRSSRNPSERRCPGAGANRLDTAHLEARKGCPLFAQYASARAAG